MKRHTLLALFTLSFCIILSTSVQAKAASAARTHLETTINAVLQELQTKAVKNPATRDASLGRIEKIIYGLFSFTELSQRTVGPAWRTFTPAQKKEFTDAFEDLLRETYINKFEGYDGEKIAYQNEISSSDGSKIEIQTDIIIKGKSIPVAYRMLEKEGKWVVYDVNIEGVSMVQNYRTQFKDLLSKGDISTLIKVVHQKAQEASDHNKKQQLAK